MVKLSENRISNNIPFAKLEMTKKLIFVKSLFSVVFFVVGNTVIPREKSLDLICFFFWKPSFFKKTAKPSSRKLQGEPISELWWKTRICTWKTLQTAWFFQLHSFLAISPSQNSWTRTHSFTLYSNGFYLLATPPSQKRTYLHMFFRSISSFHPIAPEYMRLSSPREPDHDGFPHW